jgi:hypothetical protein
MPGQSTPTSTDSVVEEVGEKIAPVWEFRFLILDEIPAGSMHAQALFDTGEGQQIAELRTVHHDLLFALQCFEEADKLGLPDVSNLLSRALINAGVMSYGRVFKGGVRSVRLDVDEIAAGILEVDGSTHTFFSTFATSTSPTRSTNSSARSRGP